jgi:dynein heavy chain 1
VSEKIREIEDQWKREKPGQSNVLPSRALDILSIIGSRIGSTKNEWIRICKAKELLEMELGDPKRLDALEDDLKSLREVWSELNKVWTTSVELVNDTPFSSYISKKVKDQLDGAVEQMKGFSNKMRQYEVYEQYLKIINNYRKVNLTIGELKSDAMKSRHWKDLLAKLGIKVSFNELTLNHLWIADLAKNDKIVREILNQARGELILEEFLRGIKEIWSKYELDLVKYQTKCKLIKGWDELFQQIDEHINNLQSMKMSPYYKVFEAEILPWDDKLQMIRIIFDNWIDVQRRYVYLEGIFFGSADIKTMLPTEFNFFKSIDSEFTGLMKKVASKPIVLEVLSIQGLQKTLERFSEMLAKIQKALGEYLENQRSSFARFYFVGDEDLLEIIGNSKEIRMVQRHFPKMFAGIT